MCSNLQIMWNEMKKENNTQLRWKWIFGCPSHSKQSCESVPFEKKKNMSISICNGKQPSTVTQGLSIFPLYTNLPQVVKKKKVF